MLSLLSMNKHTPKKKKNTHTQTKKLHLLNILTTMIYAGSHQRTCFVLNLLHTLHIPGRFLIRYMAYQAREEMQHGENKNGL